jgi:hypothetical protein
LPCGLIFSAAADIQNAPQSELRAAQIFTVSVSETGNVLQKIPFD